MNVKSGRVKYFQGADYLNELGKNQHSGKVKNFVTGIFEASHFNQWRRISHFSGVMFWFCYGKKNGQGSDCLYLAAEPKYEFIYPKADPVIARGLSPLQENLLVPLEVKGKSISGSNGYSILNEKDGIPNGQAEFEEKNEILRKVYRFLSDDDFWELNKYGHGYFEAKDYNVDFFENLLGPSNDSPIYVRYYIGLDEKEAPSQLRIFLVPVDGNGNNIQTIQDPISSKSSEPYLLQYSWPPPPKQQ
ncbi:MAG: hypothetical protein MUE75_01050 [Algoriphagus sp.]|jgi:hypothetical protein|nr:hypothetical protein [Algoriphagus sp.]